MASTFFWRVCPSFFVIEFLTFKGDISSIPKRLTLFFLLLLEILNWFLLVLEVIEVIFLFFIIFNGAT